MAFVLASSKLVALILVVENKWLYITVGDRWCKTVRCSTNFRTADIVKTLSLHDFAALIAVSVVGVLNSIAQEPTSAASAEQSTAQTTDTASPVLSRTPPAPIPRVPWSRLGRLSFDPQPWIIRFPLCL